MLKNKQKCKLGRDLGAPPGLQSWPQDSECQRGGDPGSAFVPSGRRQQEQSPRAGKGESWALFLRGLLTSRIVLLGSHVLRHSAEICGAMEWRDMPSPLPGVSPVFTVLLEQQIWWGGYTQPQREVALSTGANSQLRCTYSFTPGL